MTAETIFDNFFDSIHITSTRLRNFGDDTINRLSADSANMGWGPLVNTLRLAVDALGQELGDVDTAVNIRLGDTDTVDGFLKSFGAYMSDNEPFIARAVGGKGSPAYLEFYPEGLSEYTRANKTTGPVLLARVKTAAAKYGAQLGAPMDAELAAFEPAYMDLRGNQQGAKGSVDDNRSERTEARKNLETALLRAIYQVADKYPGNVAQCKSYFDFRRLYSAGRHHDTGSGGNQPG